MAQPIGDELPVWTSHIDVSVGHYSPLLERELVEDVHELTHTSGLHDRVENALTLWVYAHRLETRWRPEYVGHDVPLVVAEYLRTVLPHGHTQEDRSLTYQLPYLV